MISFLHTLNFHGETLINTSINGKIIGITLSELQKMKNHPIIKPKSSNSHVETRKLLALLPF
jgi:uncharacterized protein YuzE